MLSCREVTERAFAYAGGELRGMAWLRVKMHLSMCRGCTNFVAQARRTAALVRASLERTRGALVDEALVGAFVAAVSAPSRSPAPARHRRPPPHNTGD